jgi:hypothetical protein
MTTATHCARIQNRLFDELAKCQSYYNAASRVLPLRTGADKLAIEARLADLSEKMAEINRQLDMLRS